MWCTAQGTQDLLSLPAPSLSGEAGAQIGATEGARGRQSRFLIFFFSPHFIIPLDDRDSSLSSWGVWAPQYGIVNALRSLLS